MKPDQKTILLASGSVARVLSDPGKQYAFYLNNGTKCELKLDLPKGNYKADWISTLDGKIVRSESLKHSGGELSMTSPDFRDDIALKIIAQ
jgi:hypothetical protein